MEYRKYSADLSYAQTQMNNYSDANSPSKVIQAWNKGMFCYFYGNERQGDKNLKDLLEQYAPKEREFESEGKIYTRDWVAKYVHAANLLLPKNAEGKKQYVRLSITEKRQRLHNKSSYKKLNLVVLAQI